MDNYHTVTMEYVLQLMFDSRGLDIKVRTDDRVFDVSLDGRITGKEPYLKPLAKAVRNKYFKARKSVFDDDMYDMYEDEETRKKCAYLNKKFKLVLRKIKKRHVLLERNENQYTLVFLMEDVLPKKIVKEKVHWGNLRMEYQFDVFPRVKGRQYEESLRRAMDDACSIVVNEFYG